ncbi:MAG: hypothetical protein GTO16_08885 [Candidatus Aminicenantes bacterium]|nr:hypothetical protein [Candidatus Aminicenantes bacterium]
MNPKGKKFISLFLIFSLMAISCTTITTQRQKRFESSKERRGAKLIVIKKDGQRIKGELITVKPSSLLLLDTEGKDVSFDIADIKVIRIVKKSKAFLGAAIGFGAGALLGPLLAPVIFHAWHEEYDGPGVLLIEIPVGSAIGALLGGSIGATAGKDKKIQIEGMTDFHEFRETLDYLRKKARIRNYK